MKIIRLQIKRFLFVIALLLLMVMAHFFLKRQENVVSSCSLPAKTLRKVEKILDMVQTPLKELNVSHFLCYNSLWGALKVKGPLPWQNSIEVCVLRNDMVSIDEYILTSSFKNHGLSISYNPPGGFYTVMINGENVPFATLTVFDKDSVTGQMRRNGWIHRMLPPNACDKLNCFPPELIEKPLPIVKFGPYSVPVPREGIEIQKYLFPTSWWKDITPENCIEKAE